MTTSYITKSDLMLLGYSPMPENVVQDDICIAASALADNFCLQTLGRTATTEVVYVKKTASSGYNKIFPAFLPILSISSIKNYYTLKEFTDVSPENYDINNHDGCVDITPSNYGKMVITYDHGYDVIPDDAKRAVIIIASNLLSDWRKRGQTEYDNIKALDDNTLKMQFFDDTNNDNIGPSARRLLLNYRRVR